MGFRMSTLLRKQSWFVCLMAFVMGWSSLVYASSMPMQAQMLQQQLSALEPATEVISTEHPQHKKQMHIAQSDCHAASMQHHKAAADLQSSPCDRDLNSTSIKQCADCAQLHCQSLTVWLDTAVAEDLQQLQSDRASNLHSRYNAQHLIGYWQEILRPPKA